MEKIPEMERITYFPADGEFLFEWCCDCHLRHIWHFEIVKRKGKQLIKVTHACDRVAAEMQRKLDELLTKKRKKK